MGLIARVCVAAVVMIAPPTIWLTLGAVGRFPMFMCCVAAAVSLMISYVGAGMWFSEAIGEQLDDAPPATHPNELTALVTLGMTEAHKQHREGCCRRITTAQEIQEARDDLEAVRDELVDLIGHLPDFPCESDVEVLLNLERVRRGLKLLQGRLDLREGTR